jgi:6-phosphogluconolactonase (cycloisomerase 2 family)
MTDAGGNTDAATDTGTPATATALYTMTNAATNEVIAFTRAADGTLTQMATRFATGGAGSGAGLGEQGALAYDLANNRLFAVNAGDGSFSIFGVQADGSLGAATVVHAPDASFIGPKSIAFYNNLVYVLFEGDATHASRIAGWTVTGTAATPITGSTQTLSSAAASVDPAQIQFTPDGQFLVVTEKAAGTLSPTNPGRIDTFRVTAGVAGPAVMSLAGDATTAQRPYGFAFANGYLAISVPSNTTTASYALNTTTGLVTFVNSGPTEAAPCWVAAVGNHTYTANAQGLSVSGYDVGSGGSLSAIGGPDAGTGAVAGRTGQVTDAGSSGPTTDVISADGRFLYVLNARTPSIGVFRIDATTGALTQVVAGDFRPTASGGLVGLAVR